MHPIVNISGSVAEKVERESDGTLSLHLANGKVFKGFDCLLAATGRSPLTSGLGLEEVGVQTAADSGYVLVDDYQNTSADGVYALGKGDWGGDSDVSDEIRYQ